jgi:hypothetical protein
MIVNWHHAWPSITAAFLASLVEFVEALTVVLAVGTVRGWRGALIGSGGAVAVLLAIVAALGPALTRVPLNIVQLAVGTPCPMRMRGCAKRSCDQPGSYRFTTRKPLMRRKLNRCVGSVGEARPGTQSPS